MISPDPQPARDPYDLLPPAALPKLPGEVKVEGSLEGLVETLCSDLLTHSLNCVRQFGDFHLAVTARRALEPVFTNLLIDPICRGIPWKKTHLWITDEHAEEADNADSAWALLSEYFGEHAGIPRAQQHRIEGVGERAAAAYERELKAALEWRERGQDRLDCVVLAPEEKGCVAGIVPGSPDVRENTRLVAAVRSSALRDIPDRVTMTLPLINSARLVGIFVPEANQKEIIGSVGAAQESVDRAPLRGIRPVGGIQVWYVAREACE